MIEKSITTNYIREVLTRVGVHKALLNFLNICIPYCIANAEDFFLSEMHILRLKYRNSPKIIVLISEKCTNGS